MHYLVRHTIGKCLEFERFVRTIVLSEGKLYRSRLGMLSRKGESLRVCLLASLLSCVRKCLLDKCSRRVSICIAISRCMGCRCCSLFYYTLLCLEVLGLLFWWKTFYPTLISIIFNNLYYSNKYLFI